ncbi:MAG TPA: hypothetical protein VHZ24_18270 [Pirellulales bacterium]|nr:hypothetical protein [Pirellulales bacterium]
MKTRRRPRLKDHRLAMIWAPAVAAAWLTIGSALCAQQAVVAPAAAPPVEPAEPPLLAREFPGFPRDGLPTEKQVKAWRIDVSAVRRLGKFDPPELEEKFTNYYKYKLAELTWPESMTATNSFGIGLPALRKALKFQDLRESGTATEKQVHDRLNQLMLAATSAFAADPNYHPAARMNCVLLLGALDQQEPDGLGQNNIPLPAALDKLLALAGDPKQMDAVRVGAMIGIERHARLAMSPAGRTATVKLLTGNLNMGTPAGTIVMRHRAVNTLGLMAAKWPEANRPEVVAVMQLLMNDPEATQLARSDAAKSLGMVERTGFAGAPIPQLATSAGLLAAEIAKSAADPNLKFTDDAGKLQGLTHEFLSIQSGVKGLDGNHGLQSAATNEQKPFINELAEKVGDLADLSSNGKLLPSDAESRLQQKGQDLEQWIKSRNGNGANVAAGN